MFAWLQETSTHVPVCEMPRLVQMRYSPACLACHPDGKDFLCCDTHYSRCDTLCNMAAKKKPAYQDPSKKNRATTKDKPNTSSRTDVNGRSGMGVSSTRSTFESRTGIKTNKTLNTAQNIARSIVLGGVGKTVVSTVAKKVAGGAGKNKPVGPGTYGTPNKKLAEQYAKKKKK